MATVAGESNPGPIDGTSSFLISGKTCMGTGLNDRLECLKKAWMGVLQVTKGPKDGDNFLFEGGTSLEAAHLASKLRRMYNTEVGIMDVLQASNYARIIIKAKSITITREVVKTNTLSDAQKRMLLMQDTCPKFTAYIPTSAFHITNTSVTDYIFKYIVKAHPILTSKIEKDPTSLDYLVEINQQVNDLDVKYELIEGVKEASIYLRNSIPVIKTISSPLAIF